MSQSNGRRAVATASALTAATLAAGGLSWTAHAQPNASPTEEIVVTGSLVAMPRRQLGTAVSVLDGAEIELRGYDSLADVLRTQPGIGVSNVGGPGKPVALRIRGEEAYRTLLMIDGVKAVDPSGPQALPSFDSLLTTNDMERVEVLRGPQGFIYGADAGGVVNVITGRGEGPLGGRLALELGEFSTRKLEGSLSGGNETGDFYVSVADLDTDGFNARPDDDVLRDDDGAENTTLHTKLGLNPTENLRVQLVVRDIDASALFDNCDFPAVDDCRSTTEQTTYRVSAELHSGKLTHAFGYSEVDIVRDSIASGVSSFATEGNIGRLEYTGSFVASDAATFVFGVDLQNEDVDTLERDQDGYYFEYQGAFGESFFLNLGARFDDNEDFGSHTSSRVSVAYVQDVAGGALKYRASYGTGFRPPSLFEISYNLGSFAAPPAAGFVPSEESSEGLDVGIEYTAANGLRFEATYFDQEITDEIFFDDLNFAGYLQSLGASESTGIELGLAAPIGERWEVLANWTNNDAKNTDNVQRLQRPKNMANFGVLFTSMSEAFRFVANYRLSMDAADFDFDNDARVSLEDYEVLDVSATYSVNESLDVFGRVRNATDENYQEVFGYNTAGREVYGGVRVRF